MRCLPLLRLNLPVFVITVLLSSCDNFFVNQNSTNGTSTSNTSSSTTTGTGTTSGVTTTGTGSISSTGTGTTGTTGTSPFAPTGGTGTTGTTGVGTIPTSGGTGTTGATGIGTTPATGGTGTTGAFGTTVTGTTGTGTGTGTTGTTVGLFASARPPARDTGHIAQSGFLYSTAGAGISASRIDPASGNVTDTHVGGGSDGFIASLAADPNGRFLFASVTSSSSLTDPHANGRIDVLAIGRTSGTLSPVANDSVVLNQGGQKLSLDPMGRFLYTVINGGIAVYSIDHSSGTLTAIPGSPFGGNLGNLVAVSPDGKYLYNAGNGNASAYTLDSTTGKPTATGTATSTGAASESDIAVTPDGKFLFIVDRSTTVKVLGLDANGNLVPLAPSPDTGHRNTSIAIHPNGKFVYVANTSDGGGSGSVQAFSLDSSGNLKSIEGTPDTARANFSQIAIDESGKYLFASTPNGVTSFEIDQTTGALTSKSVASGNLAYSQVIVAGP